MHADYDRSSRLDGPRGYKSFARAWDIHVANRFKSKLDGNEDALIINRKSCIQLQQHYDILVQQKDLLKMSSQNDTEFKILESELRDSRKAMAPHQAAINVGPIIFPQVGRPVFGAPLALNPTVTAAAFQYGTQANDAPIAYRKPTLTPMKIINTRAGLGKAFKSTKYCWKCGYQKKFHSRFGYPFGDSCNNNCGYEECSKCGWRITDYHGDNEYGPFCKREFARKQCDDWYKTVEKVCQSLSTISWIY